MLCNIEEIEHRSPLPGYWPMLRGMGGKFFPLARVEEREGNGNKSSTFYVRQPTCLPLFVGHYEERDGKTHFMGWGCRLDG